MSDPNLSVRLDDHGLLHVDGPDGWVGAYSPDSRQLRVNRFLEKRNKRVWVKKVKYDVRKNFADSSANASAHVRAHIHEAEDLERQLENLETLSKLRKGERKTSKLEKEKEEKNKGKKIRQEKGMKVEKKVDVEEKV